MWLFFVIIAAIGALMFWLDWAAHNKSDSIPVALTGGAIPGVTMIVVSALGLICLFIVG